MILILNQWVIRFFQIYLLIHLIQIIHMQGIQLQFVPQSHGDHEAEVQQLSRMKEKL